MPGNLRPASLQERRRFYARRMDYDAAAGWMSRPAGGRVFALILGRHSGIYPRRFRHPENVDCPIHGDIAAKMARHQGLSFCDWEFEEIRRQAAELFDELARRWSRLRIVFSGRGFHVHVFDADAFRLSRKERGGIAASLARRYAIDEWVTSGEMRLIRLPLSLHGMVSRIVIPVPRRRLESFSYDDPRAVPRF